MGRLIKDFAMNTSFKEYANINRLKKEKDSLDKFNLKYLKVRIEEAIHALQKEKNALKHKANRRKLAMLQKDLKYTKMKLILLGEL